MFNLNDKKKLDFFLWLEWLEINNQKRILKNLGEKGIKMFVSSIIIKLIINLIRDITILVQLKTVSKSKIYSARSLVNSRKCK